LCRSPISHYTYQSVLFLGNPVSVFTAHFSHPHMFTDQSLLSDCNSMKLLHIELCWSHSDSGGQPPTPIMLCARRDKSSPTQLQLPGSRQWTSNKATQVLGFRSIPYKQCSNLSLLKKICTLLEQAVT